MDGNRPTNLKGNEAVVYTFDEQTGKIKPHIIELGLIDIVYAEVVKGISEGQSVISEFIENASAPQHSGGRPRL